MQHSRSSSLVMVVFRNTESRSFMYTRRHRVVNCNSITDLCGPIGLHLVPFSQPACNWPAIGRIIKVLLRCSQLRLVGLKGGFFNATQLQWVVL